MNDVMNMPNGTVPSSPLALYSRRLISILALVASLAALALVLNNHRTYWFGQPGTSPATDADSASQSEAKARSLKVLPAAEDNRYRALSDFVARRYRVSQAMAYDLVHLAHKVGRQHGLDPLLIIAVIAIESRFNPFAESMAGAKGLMQIIPRYHTDKLEEFGGERAIFDPVANVKVGSRILKDYFRLTGNMGTALQMYAGALDDGSDEYTNRVMDEQRRLRRVLVPLRTASGKNSAITTASAEAPAIVRR